MSAPVSPQSSPDRPAKTNALSGIVWPIAAFVALLVYIQWPAIQETYYRLSGTERPQSTIPWRENFGSALDEVRSSHKPMLLVFSATWCGPCNAMKSEVWSDVKVGDSVAAQFVPMHIDVDDSQQASITERYNVRSIPAIFVLDADGEILAQSSYMSRSETLAFLDAAAKR